MRADTRRAPVIRMEECTMDDRDHLQTTDNLLVQTAAYRALIDANALQTSIVALAKDAKRSSEETSKEIRELFDPAGIPPVKPRITLSFRP